MADDDGHGRAELLLFADERPAEHGLRLQHIEESLGHRRRLHALHLAIVGDRHPALRILGHRRKAARALLHRVEGRIGEGEVMALGVEPPELHHLLRARERQWPQHDAVHDAEDRRRGADAEGEGERGDEGEARRLAKLPQREADIVGNGLEPFAKTCTVHVCDLHRYAVVPEIVDVAEPAQRLNVGLILGVALLAQPPGAHLDVEAHLVVELAGDAVARARQPEDATDAARDAHRYAVSRMRCTAWA